MRPKVNAGFQSVTALCSFGSAAAPFGFETDIEFTRRALETRRHEQFEAARQFKTFYSFQFTNPIDRSGITFQHHIVDDCARDVKTTVYDHGTGLAAADVDGDGKVDIFFVNQIGGCELWRNLGDGRFENITASAGVGLPDKVCVSASFAELDNDGDPDLFVTTVKMGNVLFENLGRGKFRDVSKESGLDYVGHSSGAVFFDYDNDGLLDLFLVIADLDVVVAEFNDRPQVLISNLSDKKTIHYLKIKLEGTMSNRDGLGSTSRVKAGGKTFTQYHDGKSGYLSQSSLPLYFALGEATKVDGIKITWPSGTRQTITSKLGINCQMQIKEPSE